MAAMTFPLSPAPSYYNLCYQTARNGIWYVGDTVTVTTNQATATSYEVRDYYGNVVASGSVSGTTISLGSSWDCGWYRLYLRGASSDALYGDAYGATNFCVIPEHPNFRRLPVSAHGYYGGYVPSGTGDDDFTASNPGSAPGWNGHNFNSPVEMITRGCLGLGVGRLSLIAGGASDPNGGSTDTLDGNASFCENVAGPYWVSPSDHSYVESVRERRQWLAFPGFAFDYLGLENDGSQASYILWAVVMVLDPATVNADNLYVSCGAGTSSGYKVTVSYPDASTVVETYDNLASGQAASVAINATSQYIRVFSGGANAAATMAATAVGTDVQSGVAQVVSTLYPLGCTVFEGPSNEPRLSAYVAHQMRLFQHSVHLGHPDAIAVGPCPVTITDLGAWSTFLAAGGANYCDALSFHDYNTCVAGDVNQGRNSIEAFIALLRYYNADHLDMWQTEATHVITSVGGDPAAGAVYCPRRSRTPLLRILLWEQYGLPFERNPIWYDWSHGFWSYASFMFMGYGADKSSAPWVPMVATLARETFGKNFNHAIDFRSEPANKTFIGNVYGSAQSGSVAVIATTSSLPGSKVTLGVDGTTGPLVVVDAFGNTTSVSVVSGTCEVAVAEVPTYVRLPVGVNVWVESVNDWGTSVVSVSAAKASSVLGGVSTASIADDNYMTVYRGNSTTGGIAFSADTPPDEAVITFSGAVQVERVIIWSAAYQQMSGLLDFDVDTWDGATWTTRATVTRTPPSSFLFGTSQYNAGTRYESYWDEQWIEDVAISPSVSALGVRVVIRETSFGGMPDATAAVLVYEHGDAPIAPVATVQEISVISSSGVSLPGAYAVEVAADSPVGYWRLNEPSGSTAADSSGHNLNGTYGTGVTQGVVGATGDGDLAASFVSSTGVSVPDNNLLDVGDVFTLECWFRGDHSTFAGQSFALIAKGNNNFVLEVKGGTYPEARASLRLYKAQTNQVLCTSTVLFGVGSWTHLVATKNGSSVNLYINGQDVSGAVSNVTMINTSSPLVFAPGNLISVDEVAVYPTALSAARVLAHYVAGVVPSVPYNTVAPTAA